MGRTAELHTLETALTGARLRGTALLLRGGPGVGKTVLLDAAAARARADGTRVLHVAGVETEQDLAFSALHQLLHPLLDHLLGLPPFQRSVLEQALSIREGSAPGRFAISAAALALLELAAERTPLCVLADDVHWIDRSSAEVMTFVARRLSGCPVVFVMAARNGWDDFIDPTGLRLLTVAPCPRRAPVPCSNADIPTWRRPPAGACSTKPRATPWP
ncbi:AAA family ATPase [Streptomyces sp. NPDC051041]|uniref:AAA family ATPase n=1 Tax=Streptomyces sp. NPDC051041 TaxID=3365640 RepID=UPI0037A742BF